MESHKVPMEIFTFIFPMEIPWSMKAGQLSCRIAHKLDYIEQFQLA